MIKVLQDWREVGFAIMSLQREGLPLYRILQKNWDHFLLSRAVDGLDRDCTILDLGCGEGITLGFLSSLGFKNLSGVDLIISWQAAARKYLSMWRRRSLRLPYRLRRGNLVETSFKGSSFDVVLSISTIEHGVELEAFMREAARLLKPGGLLFMTTDYWDEKIGIADDFRAFGQKWRVFCRPEIESLVRTARQFDLVPVNEQSVPSCRDRTVRWGGAEYTFIAMVFKKATPEQPPREFQPIANDRIVQ